MTTWPISWPDIARDVLAASGDGLDDATANALIRVRHRARDASDKGFAGLGVRISGAYQPTELRDFADTPREEGELGLRASWLTSHFAINLQGSYVTNPDDNKDWRADGSYLGVNFGNFMLSAGFMERWWGPGWDNSLILSTNARPIPTLTLERNYTDPFKTKWLSWIGPWRASIAMGQMESHDVAVPDVLFFAARVNFKPKPWLEFGLTRTAQWCGGERTCDWNTFVDMVLGNDNQTEGGTDEQPGNQMAGYDMRVRSPWRKLPLVFYTQWIGEDEAGGFPSKFIGQFGLETWGSTRIGGWRVRVEYADTTCIFLSSEPEYNCAYRNTIYPQGYTYRGRIIGASMDN
ncbi:MAG TPA: capsule assembly Wzi family protein, partial [Steroidobacteraceae bacterium]|nr:capsule assembly Wzi family protein [Steroidobacteraceae bacterium]